MTIRHLLALLVTVAFTQLECHSLFAQHRLADGLSGGVTYTGDLFTNVTGGSAKGVRYFDNLDAELLFNTNRGFGGGNTELYFYGLANQGGSISGLAGDFQGISNIEAETSWRLYEGWVQTYLPDLNSSVLAGLYDLNSEFDINHTGGLFINSSHGIGAEYAASGQTGPSIFPLTSGAIRIKTVPVKGFHLKVALLDGVPSDPENTSGTKVYFRETDGLLLAGEIDIYSGISEIDPSASVTDSYIGRNTDPDYKFRLALGGWMYSKKQPGWLNGQSQQDRGLYLITEGRLFSERSSPERGLSAFLRFGVANGAVNRVAHYTGAGLVYNGPFERRPDDSIGMAIAIASNSDDFTSYRNDQDIQTLASETNIEFTYLLQLAESASLQFDVQYIVNPDMLAGIKNSLVLGTRFQISL